MKRTLIILGILFLFMSCYQSGVKQVSNPKSLTTLEVLENIDTTIQTSVVGHTAFILKDSLVVDAAYFNAPGTEPIPILIMFIILAVLTLLIVVLFNSD